MAREDQAVLATRLDDDDKVNNWNISFISICLSFLSKLPTLCLLASFHVVSISNAIKYFIYPIKYFES